MFHNFIDLKKAFNRVYHDGLWSALYKFGIQNDIIMMIKSRYANSTSAVLLNNAESEFFKTSVGVRQGCLISLTLFNLFLEEIMSETQSNYSSSILVGGRPLWNLKFADDIDLHARINEELQELTDQLSRSATRYGMLISTEKSKVVVNSNDNYIYSNITPYGEKLEEVDKFC